MKTVYFATTNQEKLKNAQIVCFEAGIIIEPAALDIDEIQGENSELIVKDKASRAFELTGKPVVVSDDSWSIKALNGFPGPYMKSINHWFSPEDFLRLMHNIEDRRITLHQYLAYASDEITKVFKTESFGEIVHNVRDGEQALPSQAVIAMDSDGGKTIAEALAQDDEAIRQRYKERRDVWHDFVEWYKKSVT